MKPLSSSIRGRAGRTAVFGLVALLVGGCYDYEKRIQWSPDGQRAAILTTEGLFLSDAKGRLSRNLSPKANAVAWLSDSQRLAVVTYDSTGVRLAIARINGEELTAGPSLYSDSTAVLDIRIAPGDAHLAFTIENESDAADLLVAPCDGSAPPAVVSQRAAAFPDWSPDGRALVYFKGGGKSDEASLGTLVRRGVVNENGKVELSREPVHLAGVLIFPLAHAPQVRCLKDGRVVFNAAEFDLPLAPDDIEGTREQLFAVETARQPTLVRLMTRQAQQELPTSLRFEVSPDERQVLFGTPEGSVHVLTLATGKVQEVQPSAEEKGKMDVAVTPVWRRAGQFTYVKRLSSGDRPAEVILREGEQEIVLSKDWSSEFIKQLVR